MRSEILWLTVFRGAEDYNITLKINNFEKKNIFVVNIWTLSLYNVIAPTVNPETFIIIFLCEKIPTCQYLALLCITASSRWSFVTTFACFCLFLPSKAHQQLVDKMDGLRRVNSRVDMFGNLVSTLKNIQSSTNTLKDPLTNITSSSCSLLSLVQLLDYQDSSSHGDGHVQSCRQIFLSVTSTQSDKVNQEPKFYTKIKVRIVENTLRAAGNFHFLVVNWHQLFAWRCHQRLLKSLWYCNHCSRIQ